ncbi:MAG: ABC transporter permease [Planctomycetota bacterium]|jgi:peptide/nickel transport system permease protein
MRTYLIKRILLMIPTIFGISLVVFVVINLAPGSPAAMQVSQAEGGSTISADQVASKETYQIFKKHFNLDKGILWNTYPWLTRERVNRRVQDWIEGKAKEKIAASDALVDYGEYAIPHVISILEEEREKGEALDPESEAGKANRNKRRHLIFLLAQNALIDIDKVERPEGRDYTEDQKAQMELNKEFRVENTLYRNRVLPEKHTPAQADRLENLWILWYHGHEGQFGKPVEIPAPEIDAAFEEAEAAGTHRALREGGKALGRAHGQAAESIVHWVRAREADLPAATEFGAYALAAMVPLPGDPLEEEEKDHRYWVKSLIVWEGSHPERVARVRERWEKWWGGREEEFEKDGIEKITTGVLDTRFAHYWRNLAVLDFGESLQYKGKRVIDLIKTRLKVSVTFALLSFLIAYTVAIPIGVFSAVWKDSIPDRITTIVLFALYSLPSFFTGVILLQVFTIGKPYKFFPTSGFQGPLAHTYPVLDYLLDVGWHLVLPVLCLSYASFAALSRYMRGGLLEVIRSDYIRTARAKGLSERVVILKHALRNGVIPILTMVGGILPALIGGSVIIEYIFNINGMGLLMIEAIFRRDYNVVMADSIIAGFLVLCGLLLTDILYVLVDPRISFE